MSPHTTRRSFTDLLLLRTTITLTPIRGTTPGWGWRGVPQDLRLVPGPAATGAIAIGAMATSTSTTIITSTETPTGTSTVVKLARATGGSITRNTAEMLPMATEIPLINSADVVRVAPGVLAVRVALAVPVVAVVSAVRVAVVVAGDAVEPAVRGAVEGSERPAASSVRASLRVPAVVHGASLGADV